MTYRQRIRQELERVAGTGEWIKIHCLPEDAEAFEVGAVTRVTSGTVFVDMVDADGGDEGSRSVSFDAIVSLTIGGAYLRRLRTLREWATATQALEPVGDGHEGMLRAAEAAGLVVTVRSAEDTVRGDVREVGEGWAAIEQIQEEDGDEDGLRLLDIEEVERVFAGGREEMRLAALSRARQMRDSIG